MPTSLSIPGPCSRTHALRGRVRAVLLWAWLGLGLARPAAAEFTEVASATGLFGGQPSWGGQLIDLDQDGDLDLLKGNHFYSGFLFTNLGNLTFTVWGLPQVVASSGDRHGWLWADLNGDGLVDAVCSHGGGGGCGCTDDGNEMWLGLGSGLYQLDATAGGMTDPLGRGRAYSAADVDGDGDLDLFHGKAPLLASPHSLYLNDGSAVFTDVAAAWGVDETIGCEGARFADVDDDGDADLLVGGIEDARPTTYYRNDGGSFTDATSAVFGTLPAATGMDWGDWDNDGDLDLVLAEGVGGVYDHAGVDGTQLTIFAHHRFGDDGVDVVQFDTPPGEDPSAIFRLNGKVLPDYVFLGPSGVNPSSQGAVLDDSLVGAPSFTPGVDMGTYVWRSSPGGTWNVHISAPPGSYGNHAMRVTTVGGIFSLTTSNFEVQNVPDARPRVWRNDGGTFTEVDPGLVADRNPRDVQWVDFDNDGDLDLHTVYRGSMHAGNEPDVLYRNDGGTFVSLEGSGWVEGSADWWADGGTWGDMDRDGDLDLFLQQGAGPLFFTQGAPVECFRNDGPVGHWLVVEPLAGPAGETPIGTRVDAWVGGERVHRRLSASPWRGFQRPLEVHVGLGDATLVDSLVVTWPDGAVQTLGPIPADRILRLTPGVDPTSALSSEVPVDVGPVFPQPSRERQSLRLAASPSRTGETHVQVFDLRGRLVKDLGRFAGARGAIVRWDGRDAGGSRVAAGVYFLRGTGAVPFERKAVRVR